MTSRSVQRGEVIRKGEKMTETVRQPGIPLLFCKACGLDVVRKGKQILDYDGTPHEETCEGEIRKPVT